MKIAVIGGAGVRVPLLINGLASAGLGIEEFALYDPDALRLEVIGPLAARRAGTARVTTHAAAAPALEGARFVITSIRVGGIEARMHDERAALALGFVGQETVGPGGFAMAVRTIPPLVACAREVMRPGARRVDRQFHQSRRVGDPGADRRDRRARGRHLRHADGSVPGSGARARRPAPRMPLRLHRAQPPWVHPRGVVAGQAAAGPAYGTTRTGWPASTGRRCSRWRAFGELRLLPTEYVFYYDAPERAVANLRAAGDTRGAVIARLTRELFDDLRKGVADPVARYERYLAERSAGYMQLESGSRRDAAAPAPWAHLTGYDKIALEHDPGHRAATRTRSSRSTSRTAATFRSSRPTT